MKRSSGRRAVPALAGLGLVVAVWYAISYLTMSESRRRVALPPPHDVVRKGLLAWQEDAGLPPILRSLWVTARVSLAGLVIAGALALMVAWIMHRSTFVERAVFPWAVVIQTTPILVLVPLLKIWFGASIGSRVLVCVLISIFPIITNAHFGFRSVPSDLLDLFALSEATGRQRFVLLEFPHALPAILAGLRIGAGASVIGAVVGDFFFRQGSMGIGRLIDNLQKDARTAELFAATLVCSLYGVAVFSVFGLLARRYGSWTETDGRADRTAQRVSG